MNPVVDRDLCIGCGACEDHCPEVFRIDEGGLSYVLNEDPDPELYGAIRDCVEACPVGAISFTG